MNAELTAGRFAEFYGAVHGYEPFPWQTRLAEMVCASGEWPRSIDLPTASGKTSCIDIALFAMAVRGAGPRRIFFVIDRRVVVDQALERMEEIAEKIAKRESKILEQVATRLVELGGDKEEPVTAWAMRGGVYRDDAWVRSPLQPTLIASTVDQVGSRILFRGYGVSDKLWPMHAAVLANDALILLDEAHCSTAFAQTLSRIAEYRRGAWAREPVETPFGFVQMTATPVGDVGEPFRLNEDDYRHPTLRKRLFTSKPVRLAVSKARLKDVNRLAADLVDHAEELAEGAGRNRIAVMVNRVRTARRVFELLKEHGKNAHLLIGRMRPVDRESLPAEVLGMAAGNARGGSHGQVFVVATQCLEVGADLDFDALVTECASVDALLQRFGRLDRLGRLAGGGEGRVVASTPMTDGKYVDAVYRESLSETWRWLSEQGESLDLGICSEAGDNTARERLARLGEERKKLLYRESPPAPMLLPAHLDMFVQTWPRPAIDPDPAVFLHGKESSRPEVQVIWRADLNEAADPEEWADVVALCPPTSNEAMPVPLWEFQRWVAEQGFEGGSDVEGADIEPEEGGRKKDERRMRCGVLRWRGDQSKRVNHPREIRAGDTLILSEASKGWEELGHVPEPASGVDAAERGLQMRGRWALRLHPVLIERWPENDARKRLEELATDDGIEMEDMVEALGAYKAALPDGYWLKNMISAMPDGRRLEAYPSRDGAHVGWVLAKRGFEADAGQDESSASREVGLDDHLRRVSEEVSRIAASTVGDDELRGALVRAAEVHDCGKADVRFQALLRGGDPVAAQYAPKLLAKGAQSKPGKKDRQAQWRRSGLPDGFRHELISLALVRANGSAEFDDLTLHLIASHHGRGRPFAPVVFGESGVSWKGWRVTVTQAAELAGHRLDAGVADRFWKLTRRFGWWGLAWLETLLRLGDWNASEAEVTSERDAAAGA